jgi:hypothetical protein
MAALDGSRVERAKEGAPAMNDSPMFRERLVREMAEKVRDSNGPSISNASGKGPASSPPRRRKTPSTTLLPAPSGISSDCPM